MWVKLHFKSEVPVCRFQAKVDYGSVDACQEEERQIGLAREARAKGSLKVRNVESLTCNLQLSDPSYRRTMDVIHDLIILKCYRAKIDMIYMLVAAPRVPPFLPFFSPLTRLLGLLSAPASPTLFKPAAPPSALPGSVAVEIRSSDSSI